MGEDGVEVSHLGSMNEDARRLELDLLIRLWQAGNPGATASVL
jgi:hypothetical protein